MSAFEIRRRSMSISTFLRGIISENVDIEGLTNGNENLILVVNAYSITVSRTCIYPGITQILFAKSTGH